MASVPPIVDAAPEQEDLLVRIARAVMARERHKLGIPEQERAAANDQREERKTDLAEILGQVNAARIAQEMEFAPAANAAALDLSAARSDESRAEAEYKRAGGRERAPLSLEQQASEALARGDMETYQRLLRVRKEVGQADDRAPVARTAISLQLPVAVMDKKTNQLVYVTKEDVLANPDRYVPPPTAAERNTASGVTAGQQGLKLAQQRAMPVLQDIGSRALALNKGGKGGAAARFGGAARGVAGRMGMDSSADLYTSGIRGFVPLFARAVGHVGVLTELDVKRTEDLFPRIGDAENVTLEKMQRIQRIMTGQEPMPFQFEQPTYDEGGITQPDAPAASAESTKVINGVTYRKVPGGWQKVTQ